MNARSFLLGALVSVLPGLGGCAGQLGLLPPADTPLAPAARTGDAERDAKAAARLDASRDIRARADATAPTAYPHVFQPVDVPSDGSSEADLRASLGVARAAQTGKAAAADPTLLKQRAAELAIEKAEHEAAVARRIAERSKALD